jgi:hypothetical protein
VSPDTDFSQDILTRGWKSVRALRFEGPKERWHTFGEHAPNYTPAYTYSKYLVEGRRYRYRRAFGEFKGHFEKLERSSHEAAPLAQLAMAHGVFLEEDHDLLSSGPPCEEELALQPWLAGVIPGEPCPRFRFPYLATPSDAFTRSFEMGVGCRQTESSSAFARCLKLANGLQYSLRWPAKIGLCHGLFFQAFVPSEVATDYRLLEELLPESVVSYRARRWSRPYAKVRVLLSKVCGRTELH